MKTIPQPGIRHRLLRKYHRGMRTTLLQACHQPMIVAAVALLFIACSDEAPLEPRSTQPETAQFTAALNAVETSRAIAKLRRATDRYHNLNVAIADGFVHLHDCEVRPGEGPVGIVYVHPGRLSDAVIDPSLPEGLIYEPASKGRPRLVGAELVVPFALWPSEQPPRFMDATFQPEDEFGVFGLHVWIWRHNPNGMFAESNPTVSCEPKAGTESSRNATD